MKKLALIILGLLLALMPTLAFAGFDASKIMEDDAFTNAGAMTDGQIQAFLDSKGGILAGYSEGGRSAASIIGEAARRNNINPQVLLTTLQKEMSLITLTNYNTSTDPNNRLKRAMGYACPDSGGCDDRYAGFTNQVDGAAFQFRFNFDGSTNGRFSGYQVGQTMTFDGQAVTIGNKATASLYRYTPHISGNQNYYNLYFAYFLDYASKWAGQNSYPTLAPGDSYKFNLSLLNTGNKIWTNDIVKLGTDRSRDRVPRFWLENRLNGDPTQWNTNNRVSLDQQAVGVGATGTFNFYMTVPTNTAVGTYREYFRPVAEGFRWMDDDQIYWDVKVENHKASFAGQNLGVKRVEVGESFMAEIVLKNSGQTTWRNDGATPVRLGTSRNKDRLPAFIREDVQGGNPSGWTNPNRIKMVESTVAPGENGTFRFYYTVPASMKPGTYREYFQPVHENVRWMEDLGIYFDVVVGAPKASFVSQSDYPTLAKNESAQLWVKLKNEGSTTWTKNGPQPVRLGASRPNDRVPGFIREDVQSRNPSGWVNQSRVSLVEDTVPPGEVGTFRFWITVPGDKAAGKYREYFNPVQDNVAWFNDMGLFWDITVR